MEDAHAKEVEEVVAHFSLNLSQGLSSAQVVQGREQYGANELPAEEGTPLWRLVLKQFDDYLVKILLGAAVVDFIIAIANGETGVSAFVEPGVILLILIANAIVGVVTETNAEKAIEELRSYEADDAAVVRDGRVARVPARDLVPGDVVEISVGQKVPADLRLAQISSKYFLVDQSILTGESASVEKTLDAAVDPKAVYQDKTCILFSGTVVTVGRGRAVVIGTGAATAIGKIRDAMAESAEELTPLKQKLDDFGNFLSKVIAVICILVWVMNIGRFGDPLHGGWFQGAVYYFKIAVALAVAAIPEGLPAVVTTCLALGTRRMARQNAIVRSLPSVETLGCTTVICSDKTGTLTTNQMSVSKIAILSSGGPSALAEYNVTGSTYSPTGNVEDTFGRTLEAPADSPILLRLATCAALCNDSSLYFDPAKDRHERVGEATEVALRVLVEKIGLPSSLGTPVQLSKQERAAFCNSHWQQQYQKVAGLEFSRDRKMMSVLCQRAASRPVLFVKGAPEAVLERCTQVAGWDAAAPQQLSPKLQRQFLDKATDFGSQATLRCLALAVRQMPPGSTEATQDDERGLTLLGVVGMHDPPRAEVRAAVEQCARAGVRLIVVTGDNKATAESVCRQIGALGEALDEEAPLGQELSVTGAEFDNMTPQAQASTVSQMVVFSRVEPAHKTKLVELLKAQGQVVAMTGDGVNDAPALKRADIGIAMGSGTAVARHAADMVLADDNFATIVAAVAEGRAIFANTKQFIRYMVSSNIGEVVAIFFAALIGMPEVLNPVQLLWVNLVTDGPPATALGFNPPDDEIMTSKPRRSQDGIVDRWLFFRYLAVGLYVGCSTVAGFAWWFLYYSKGPQMSWGKLLSSSKCTTSCEAFQSREPMTVAMSVLVVVEMFNALNALSENESLLRLPPWANKWLLGAITLSMLLHCFILYVPWAALLFSVEPLDREEWLAVICLSLPVILVDEILKVATRSAFVRSLRAPHWVVGACSSLASRLPGPFRRLALSADSLLPSHLGSKARSESGGLQDEEERVELMGIQRAAGSFGSQLGRPASPEIGDPLRRPGTSSLKSSSANLAAVV